MTKKTQRRTLVSRFLRDRRGNFAMMAAFAFPVMLAAAGVAIDLTNMVLTKGELQDASDAAALAAASALAVDGKSVAEAKLIGMGFFKTQMSNSLADGVDLNKAATIDIQETVSAGGGKSFKVDVSANYDVQFNAFTRLLGQTSKTMHTKSTSESATESKNALSMFLVLDRSGSMSFITNEKDPDPYKKCQNHTAQNWYNANLSKTKPCYISKIAALKTAVASLAVEMDTLDPNEELVRTAAVSYSDTMQTETELAWGTKGALGYVNALPVVPLGGTDSHAAFAKALDKLAPETASKETEVKAHKDKNGQTPTKYIIFMTDGENTHYNGEPRNGQPNDWYSNKSDGDTSKSCETARDRGVIVYTVAFLAPKRGKELLQSCANTFVSEKDPTDHYYEADDMEGLINAFKEIGQRAAAVASRLSN